MKSRNWALITAEILPLRFWKRYMPRLDLIDAAGGALDMELAWVPRGSRDENGFPKKKNGNTTQGDVT